MLGKSPCMYSGSFDPNGYYCPDVPMPVTSLPIECSSFIYDGVVCNENFEFNPSDNDLSKEKPILENKLVSNCIYIM